MRDTRLVFLVLAAMAVRAQTGGSTLTGLITDPAGAVVAGVPVTARHIDTGTTVSVESSETGNYTIAQLPVGQYEITVALTGFKTYRRAGLRLASAQTQRLDIALEVGAASESVTVTAEASLLQNDSGALTHNIMPDDIQNLPLLPVGTFVRDPFALAAMLPGVVNTGFPLGPGIAPRVNGLVNTANQFRLDGEVMGQVGASTITTRTQPSPDAIQEMAVQTSNFNAEYGSVSGALFNITMKSGTNKVHGTVYDYAVNEFFNANDHAVHSKNRVRRHDYGFNIGGPVRLPGVYNGTNKTFFFFNFEQYRDKQLQRNVTAPTVPIQSFRDGDFSGLFAALNNQNLRLAASAATGLPARDYVDPLGNTIRVGTIFDPRSTVRVACNTAISRDCGVDGTLVNVRMPFPGNRVPLSLMDPVALAIQKYIPLPQGPNFANGILINNYYNPFETSRITNTPSIKLDHNINAKGRISFTYSRNYTNSPVQTVGGARGLPEPISTNRGTFESGSSYRLNFDYTLKPTLILHWGFGFSRFNFSDASVTTDYNAAKEIGLRGATLDRHFPSIGSSEVLMPALGGMIGMGPGVQANQPEQRPSSTMSLTYVRGRHSYKFGADFRQDMLTQQTFTNTSGNYGGFLGNGVTWQPALQGILGFTGNTNVGFGYANFLLGSVRSLTLSVPIRYRRQKQQWGMYLQDTWRARRNLTIDYGLRWDYGTYSREDYGRLSNLSLNAANPAADGRLGGLIYEATCKCDFAANYPYAIGPRLGLAYTFDKNTVLRGGFGVAYGSTPLAGGSASNSATVPTPAAGEEAFKLRDGIPASVAPAWPTFDPAQGHAFGAVIAAPALIDPNAGRPDRIYQWNLSLQRQFKRNIVVQASYVANRAVWQSIAALQDMNAITPELLARYGFKVGDLADATLLNTLWSNLSAANRATLAQRGVTLPYASFPVTGATSQTVLQSLRPYPQYTGAITPAAPLGRSWYDSLQLTANKRFSHGLQVNANYTWAKNLNANGSGPDILNRATAKDYSANPPHSLRVSFQYEVQKPNAAVPVLGNKVLANAIGGWAVAAAMFYQSGALMSRPLSGAANPISRWLGRGPGDGQLRKNADGSFMSPWSVNWVDLSGKQRTGPLDVNCRCFDPEKTVVLNPDAWEAVPDATFASQTQSLPFFRAPRRPSESMNLARNFRFGKERRYTFQVRMEFQNVFNRTFLPSPTIGGQNFLNAANSLTRSADGRYTAGFGTFGNLRVAGSLGSARSGQFIARFNF